MNTLRKIWGAMFSTNVLLGALKNDVAHLLVEFEKGVAVIKEAEMEFLRVKDTTSQEFASLKRSTIERTRGAVEYLKDDIALEADRIEEKAQAARAKNKAKADTINSLAQGIDSLSLTEHTLG